MNTINANTVKKIFVEYGITHNANAYNPHDPKSMEELRKVVSNDAKRFLKVTFGEVYHISNNEEDLNIEILTNYFFATVMSKGIKNVAQRGWRD
tara:strand:+ start:498 stop:779 length:282 start_codon:yes stop_codon:yes gene_type:complete